MRRAALVLVCLLALAACGDDDEGPPASPANRTTDGEESAPVPTEGTAAEGAATEGATAEAGGDGREPAGEETALPENPALEEAPAGPPRVFVAPEGDLAPIEEELGQTNDDIDPEFEALFLDPREQLEATTVEREVPESLDPDAYLSVRFPRFVHPDGRLSRMIDERVQRFMGEMQSRSSPGVDCGGSATRHFVSVRCASFSISERGGTSLAGRRALLLEVRQDGLRELRLADLLAPGADLDARARQACVQLEEPDFECDEAGWRPVYSLGAGGVTALFTAFDTGNGDATTATLHMSYAHLASSLLATGPLARSLHRSRVRTRLVEGGAEGAVEGAAPSPAEPTQSAWAIGQAASRAEQATRWALLPEAARADVRLLGDYLVAPDEARATAIAGVGVGAQEVQVARSLSRQTLRLMHTTRDAELRVDPSRTAPVSRRLPRGTIVVAPPGAAGERYPAVVAHADAAGFVDARALAPFDGCTPEVSRAVASLPAPQREAASLTTLRAATAQQGWGRAILISERADRAHVELHRLDGECAFERVIAAFDRSGPVRQLEITHSERGGGEALIVSVADTAGPAEATGREAAVHSYDTGRAIWTHALGDAERLEVGRQIDGRWFPVVLEEPRRGSATRFAWSGATLAEDVAAAPAPAP